MYITDHAREKRKARYSIIKKEIFNGIELDVELARTILGRFSTRSTYKSDKDVYILRNDLMGIYILNGKKIITYIDTSDKTRQQLLKKLFKKNHSGFFSDQTISRQKLNKNISFSNSIIMNFSIDTLNSLRQEIEKKNDIYFDGKKYPLDFILPMKISGKLYEFNVKKQSPSKNTKVTLKS